MIRFLFILILVIPCVGNAFGLQSMSMGHREYMKAGAGSTNTCSPGQFVLNPAGTHCETREATSESFGSAAIDWFQMNTVQGAGVQDSQRGDAQVSPGFSMFAQSYHDENLTYGMWASVYSFKYDRVYSFSSSGIAGNYSINMDYSYINAGPEVSWRYRNFLFGFALGAGQLETHVKFYQKYKAVSDYYTTTSTGNGAEQFAYLRGGGILESGKQKYSLFFSTSTLHLAGTSHLESTLIATNGTFNENSKTGKTDHQNPFQLGVGYESEMRYMNGKLGGQISWKDISSSEDTTSTTVSTSYPRTIEVAGFFGTALTEKVDLYLGYRNEGSVSESANESKSEDQLYTVGFIRKYKAVEIGTTFAYEHFVEGRFNKDQNTFQESSSINRYDVAFSSTFKY